MESGDCSGGRWGHILKGILYQPAATLSSVEDSQWNSEYWKRKFDIVGVFPPVERTARDLDPPCLYQVRQDYNMIIYLVGTIRQFQLVRYLAFLLANSEYSFIQLYRTLSH